MRRRCPYAAVATVKRRASLPGCVCAVFTALSTRLDSLSCMSFPLLKNPVLCSLCQRCALVLITRFGIDPHYRFRTGEAIADPRAIIEDQLQAIGAHHLLHLLPRKLRGILPHLLSELVLHLIGQAEVLTHRIEGTIFAKQLLELLPNAAAAACHHLRHQQAGDEAVLLRHMAADGQTGALLAADRDLVFEDQFADELE